MYSLLLWCKDLVESLDYAGIFLMTFIEGSFIPVPSEFTLIPAGHLIAEHKFSALLVLIYAISGTVSGALFSYYLALKFGRNIILKYGKYFFMTETKMAKIEQFFVKHGSISVFIGRLLPGLKHFISLPAGLGRMNLKVFFIYSTAGSALWVSLVVTAGYYIGSNTDLLRKYMHQVNVVIFVAAALGIAFYLLKIIRNRNKH